MDAKEKMPWIAIGVLAAAAIGYVVWSMRGETTPGGGEIPEGTVCTMEAKMCPDGSYVGRQGPDCEFAPCPDASAGIEVEFK